MDLKQQILLVASVWGTPFKLRRQAMDDLPSGVDADVELSLSIAGRLYREPSHLVDPAFDPLCPAVLIRVAKQLKVHPEQLEAALRTAIAQQTTNRTFQPDAGFDREDPYAQAIETAVETSREKLKRTRRAGSTRFQPNRAHRFTRTKVNVRRDGAKPKRAR